jgi:D-alanyl-D-alanine endopeptidase (penicillin-binding protein 7)
LGIIAFVLGVLQPIALATQVQVQAQAGSSNAKPVKSKVIVQSGAKAKAKAKAKARARVVAANSRPLKPSHGQLAGLHASRDALELKSSVALVIDQDTSEVLFSKNDKAVLPIASLTKLMTGLVVNEAKLAMDEKIVISQADVDTEKGSSSRLSVGTELSRAELLHLALMSSENRAAHALGRSHPGGLPVFVALMNAKARSLGMSDTSYVDPTGLSSKNQSSANDLVKLVTIASTDALLREFSTSPGHQVEVGHRTLQYNNTNRLVKNPAWDIGLQKTGYISEAGQCLVMQARVAGRKLIMVFLDSAGKLTRLADAERVRRWVESTSARASRSASTLGGANQETLVAVR